MIRLLALCCLLPACQPQTVHKPLSSIPASALASTSTDAETVEKSWESVPTRKVAVGQNIWLETTLPPEEALASLVGESLQRAGSQLVAGTGLAATLPKQPPVCWLKRSPGIERRVILDLEVVLQQGFLEHLLSRSEAGKNHESILSSPFDAEILYIALVAAGLKPGKPAKFVNENREYDFKPATGDIVKIYLEYQDETGKLVTVPAQNWVVQAKNGKPLQYDWVFAGSYRGMMETAQGEKQPYFGANDGRVVCLTNYGSALLDLPVESVDSDPQGDHLGYKANTAVIPKLETRVRAIFEPAPGK
ncbi:MAG TPA: YdjY domain-containing protein [Gemmatales bacterium]|nr:YdjY domain-containing protein [Gemmatales bacterium]HMP16658.1 YdjY domain-containing protein [Gemmatales bacterium]